MAKIDFGKAAAAQEKKRQEPEAAFITAPTPAAEVATPVMVKHPAPSGYSREETRSRRVVLLTTPTLANRLREEKKRTKAKSVNDLVNYILESYFEGRA